jgi:fatty acid desaturase
MSPAPLAAEPTRPATEGISDAELARQVHGIVRDLIEPSPAVFWADFLITLAVAYSCLGVALFAEVAWPWQVAAGAIAAVALYRASIFTHELAHIRRGSFAAFTLAWNLLFGIPCFMPTFLYTEHRSHHVNHSYGTQEDGEYFPLGLGPVGLIYVYLASMFLIPLGAIVRFMLLAPLSLLVPPLRTLVWERASSLATMNPSYRRPPLDEEDRWLVALQESACSLWCWILVCLLVAGILPWIIVPKLYAVFALLTTMNYLRALGAHRYLNPGPPMSYKEQLLDSTTIPGDFLTEFWAPLGMRYHALHHLVPSLPYHNMPEAHERLMRELPADSPYRATIFPSLWAAIGQVFADARRERAAA